MNFIRLGLLLTILVYLIGCTPKGELGTESNPIKMYFVPSMEAGKVVRSGEAIADLLLKETGYHFEVAVPTSYAAVIEAMGSNEADIAWLAPFAYILANSKYDAEVALTTVRNGLTRYRGQFVARSDSNLDSIEDIEGEVIAYTDYASTSGYIYPSSLLKQKGIEPNKSFIAGSHPAAIISVYEGKADVGCSYWSPPKDGVPQDARKNVKGTIEDVVEKVKIIGYTDWIPNDTVTFRKKFPEQLKTDIVDALLSISETEKGQKVLKELYEIDGFIRSTDKKYNIVRKTLKAMNAKASDYID